MLDSNRAASEFLYNALISKNSNVQCYADIFFACNTFTLSSDVHDLNAVVKITICTNGNQLQQSVLITGDISSTLAEHLITTRGVEMFENVNYALVPHHGSFRKNQDILLQEYAKRDIVSIISSVPRGPWWLPKQKLIQFLQQNQWEKLYSIVHKHMVLYSMSDSSRHMECFETREPLFITSTLREKMISANYPITSNIYICCNFYELSNALRYMPNNIVEYFGFAKSLGNGNYCVDNSVNDLRTALSNYANNQYVLLIDKCNATNCGIQIMDVLNLLKTYSLGYSLNNASNSIHVLCCQQRDLPLQQNMLDIIEKRCILTPLDESDTVENDAEICNECCMLL